ncbi:MAG: SIS domain-containing protein [Fusobacterium sp.]|nr:SIS domain-containing protein [Fusobacterium sp.]
MFNFSDDKLNELKAFNTVREIESQPNIWLEAFDLYKNQEKDIKNFLDELKNKYGKVKVIFTGAGTSAYVGDVLFPHLKKLEDENFSFEAIATTDIVSNPEDYLQDVPTLLVSFARSGNSPESLQAVNLANKLIKNIHHLAITCAKDGKLAINLKDDSSSYVMLMPEKSNDKGFAMTSSYTCMLLSALMVFDKKDEKEKEKIVNLISSMGKKVLAREEEIEKIINLDFDRVVYLGSGSLKALTREAQLKILELTAGKITTCFDSSMGFRHGPKSFVDTNTLVFDFVSNNDYTQKYDVDIINEIHHDKIAKIIVAITKDDLVGEFPQFSFNEKTVLDDVYLSFPYIMFAQTVSVMASLKVKNLPDTPSANGTVNRVVKGVIIHEL